MTEEVLPESPQKGDSIQFQQAEGSTLRVIAFSMAIILGCVFLLLSDLPFGPFIKNISLGGLVVFSSLVVRHLYHLAKGKRLGGLLADRDGIVDRTTIFSMGRVYWHEIKAVYPVKNPSIPGFAKDLPVIGLDVTDSFLQRKPARMLLQFWINKHIVRAPDIQISSKTLTASRDEILQVLQDGLRNYELRSISEAKELESGSKG